MKRLLQLIGFPLRLPVVAVALQLKAVITLLFVVVATVQAMFGVPLFFLGAIITADESFQGCRDCLHESREMIRSEIATYPPWISFLFSGGEIPL